ncbi:hypothetical protein [Amycolatopsis cihanbeyliensis]|uniref:Cadmium carbonic anhydrase-like repeat protein n=1 Tax=Amycolatopsis cihanbeyliensis TaxID=1128664 RepID=A0A542DE98_AMYCI|nr:hypothetical protein [Amycolatopsis cihanbeyliensis]TQJ01405.1 hypothetical protein FB471_1083 [Amycolatopsis cihanbeyliensis]
MRGVTHSRNRARAAFAALLVGTFVLVVPSAAGADSPRDQRNGTEVVSGEPRIVHRQSLPDGSERTTVRIGPLTMKPHEGGGHDHGVRPTHGPDEPMHGTHTRALALLLPPCVNCYITGIQPDLSYADGSSANYHSGAMLHHAVFFDRSRSDVTCQDGWVGLAGRRIFATGNERTGGALPDGYGVRYGFLPLTYVALELMNMKPEEQRVFFEVTMTHVPAGTPGMDEVTPVWLDADNCRLSEHSVPEGESNTRWEWTSTIEGTFKGAGGHIHDGGESITLSNLDTEEEICSSRAGYGSIPEYEGHIESMSTCLGPDLGSVREGERLGLHSVYHSSYPQDDAMSIMVAFVDEND